MTRTLVLSKVRLSQIPAQVQPAPMAPASQAVPPGRWWISMRWQNLLFAHWAVPMDLIRPLVPAGLEIDTFDGHPYLGIVPFHMTNIRARLLPPLPMLTEFSEINVRTYV